MSAKGSSLRDTVKWYQTILKVAAGFPEIDVDGNHNNKQTKIALRQFQQTYDLRVTGYLTVESNGALNQKALEFIYRKNIANIYGKWGKRLKQKIKEFQTDYDLKPDGRVGPVTRSKMAEVLTGELALPLRNYHPVLGQGIPLPLTTLQRNEPLVPPASGDTELEEVVIGQPDDRDLVGNTDKVPYSSVCSL